MKVYLELSKTELTDLVIAHFQEKLNMSLLASDLKIETKSKQNFKAEWEEADFRASYSGTGL